MKLGMDHVGPITDEKLRFLQQMGVCGIMANLEPGPENKGYHSYARLYLAPRCLSSFSPLPVSA